MWRRIIGLNPQRNTDLKNRQTSGASASSKEWLAQAYQETMRDETAYTCFRSEESIIKTDKQAVVKAK
jgi:hypothetical protein